MAQLFMRNASGSRILCPNGVGVQSTDDLSGTDLSGIMCNFHSFKVALDFLLKVGLMVYLLFLYIRSNFNN